MYSLEGRIVTGSSGLGSGGWFFLSSVALEVCKGYKELGKVIGLARALICVDGWN